MCGPCSETPPHGNLRGAKGCWPQAYNAPTRSYININTRVIPCMLRPLTRDMLSPVGTTQKTKLASFAIVRYRGTPVQKCKHRKKLPNHYTGRPAPAHSHDVSIAQIADAGVTARPTACEQSCKPLLKFPDYLADMNLRRSGFDERLSGGILPRPIGADRIPRMFFANLDDPSIRLIRRTMYGKRQALLQIGSGRRNERSRAAAPSVKVKCATPILSRGPGRSATGARSIVGQHRWLSRAPSSCKHPRFFRY